MGNKFSSINVITGQSQVINSNIGVDLNAIGYNTLDNLIYGIEAGTNNLIVIDANGNIGKYGVISNLPTPATLYQIGTIDGAGHLFIAEQGGNVLYTVDVNTTSSTFGQLVDPANNFALDTAPYGTTLASNVNITDWAINSNDGFLYSVQANGSVIRVNQVTGAVTTLTTTGVPASASNYGPIYSFSDGQIYATNNATGGIYRITISGNTATGILFSNDSTTLSNDGASCLNAILQMDFGDAPDTTSGTATGNYKTLLSSDGPRHGIVNNLMLGAQVTGEEDAYQNSTATGDDIPLGIQDDGPQVLPLSPAIFNSNSYTFNMRVFNNTGSVANLYAWLDYNQDGVFQTNESFQTTVQSSGAIQVIPVTFNKPVGSTNLIGRTFIRARLTTDTLVNTGGATAEDTRSFGPASNGEVEDYLLEITSNPFQCGINAYRVSV